MNMCCLRLRLRWVPTSVAMVLLLSACAALSPESAVAPFTLESVAGVEWVAVAIDGVVPVIHPKPKLRWTSAGQVAGSGGCNAFVGKTIVGSDSVRFGALAATGKACMTAPTGQEDLFFKAIETTRKARLENEELLLLNESGETLARLVKAN